MLVDSKKSNEFDGLKGELKYAAGECMVGVGRYNRSNRNRDTEDRIITLETKQKRDLCFAIFY